MTAAPDLPDDNDVAPFSELAPLAPLSPHARTPTQEAPTRGLRARVLGLAWSVGQTALPLAFLAALAGFSWWLVENAPQPMAPVRVAASATVPDVELEGVKLRQYDATGREAARIDGVRLRHFAGSREVRIDRATLHWQDAQGIVHEAMATQAVTDDTTSRVELRGDARVRRDDPLAPAEFRGENLQFDTRQQLLTAPQGVELEQAGSTMVARSLSYTREAGVVDLLGVRGRIVPGVRAGPIPRR